ncbi:MAG: hypothetical protein SFY81_01830 [Verrucomicrobiota bacterium]|nr:hypothetical protein [Verrucomicrobiota bacterium]
MLRLARLQMNDARYSNFMGILTSVGKVTGRSESGILRDIFNSPYFSLSGELHLKTILAVLLNERIYTPLNGISLEQLAEGNGPRRAWAQYFDISVDVRALVNTVVRLGKRTYAKKELEKPFPYALQLTDLAAYEIRAFGFPLLMFYKRGLLKEHNHAFTNDYAFGVVGTKIVERFPTRTSMEKEIRSGRMAPLGYVRIPDGIGNWRETHLAVFSHVISEGKYRGKTALIIYGLKAYEEQSELAAEELEKFKQFEGALLEGGVIKELLITDSNNGERVIQTMIEKGSGATEGFAALLGGLFELRRLAKYEELGIKPDRSLEQIIGDLSRSRNDAFRLTQTSLKSHDPYFSAFTFRETNDDDSQLRRWTLIPSQFQIQKNVRAVEKNLNASILRARALEQKQPIVYLNEIHQMDGATVIGSPALDFLDEFTNGVGYGSDAFSQVVQQVQRLPFLERARIRLNRFAGFRLPFLFEDGTRREFFVTVEFPVGSFNQIRTNQLSGLIENVFFQDGQLCQVTTDERITVVNIDSKGIESGTRTFINVGNVHEPKIGKLLEETKTLQSWSQSALEISTNTLVLSKFRLNYVTGEQTVETYGLYDSPLEIVSRHWITKNFHDEQGNLVRSDQFENRAATTGISPLLEPVTGKLRYQLLATTHFVLPKPLGMEKELKWIQRIDAVRHFTNWVGYELKSHGKKAVEVMVENSPESFTNVTIFTYGTAFSGLIPEEQRTFSASGRELKKVRMINLDPLSGSMTGMVEDLVTGSISKNEWAAGLEMPLTIAAAERITRSKLSLAEDSIVSETRTTSGEILEQREMYWDERSGKWQSVIRKFADGLEIGPKEIQTHSASGRLEKIQIGDQIEVRPIYDSDGVEIARHRFIKDQQGAYSTLTHKLGVYRWNSGALTSEEEVLVEGATYQRLRVFHDHLGRRTGHSMEDIGMRTTNFFAGSTDRVIRSETYNSSGLISATETGTLQSLETNQVISLRHVPNWGLVKTNYLRADDPFGRSILVQYENGETLRDRAWFPGTDIATLSEQFDPGGRLLARSKRRPFPEKVMEQSVDEVKEQRFNMWGDETFSTKRMMLRGTDLVLQSFSSDEAIIHHPDARNLPAYSISLNGTGKTLFLDGKRHTNISAIFLEGLVGTNATDRNILQLTRIELEHGQVSALISEYDRSGKLLNQTEKLLPNSFLSAPEALNDIVSLTPVSGRTIFRYEPGSLMPIEEGFLFQRNTSSSNGAVPVNISSRQFITSIEVRERSLRSYQTNGSSDLFVSRRMSRPTLLRTNSFLPGESHEWLLWREAEYSEDGDALVTGNSIYNGEGKHSVTISEKQTSDGREARKALYTITALPLEDLTTSLTFSNKSLLPLPANDLSIADFVYFQVGQPEQSVGLRFEDSKGRSVLVRDDASRKGEVRFWAADPSNVRWLPDRSIPEQACSIQVKGVDKKNIRIVSIHELASAGLDVHDVRSVEVSPVPESLVSVIISPMRMVVRGASFVKDHKPLIHEFIEESRTSGLEILTRRDLNLKIENSADEDESFIRLGGKLIGLRHVRQGTPSYPVLVILDQRNTGKPQPLYALSPETGRFLEHYRTESGAESLVYTIVNGFQPPRYDLYRATVLEDELTSGEIGYGYDYSVRIRYAKGQDWATALLAEAHNNIVANLFKHSWDQIIAKVIPIEDQQRRETINYFTLHDAAIQSRVIARLPMLVEQTISTAELPWTNAVDVGEESIEIPRSLSLELLRLHIKSFPAPGTGLIPTANHPATRRFVDTVREADIIQLCLHLGEKNLARELMQFYEEKSNGGTVPLHASYDGLSGTARAVSPEYLRPIYAPNTAEAQIAIAECALLYGLQAGEARFIRFGKNLLSTLLREFRTGVDIPAVSESIARRKRTQYGMTQWPTAAEYSLTSNARLLLLLENLRSNSSIIQQIDSSWWEEMQRISENLKPWIQSNFVIRAIASGVPPRGLFEIQEVKGETSALAPERISSTPSWITLLEAGDVLEVDKIQQREWLENLARGHGVWMSNVWGLDWSLAITRPEIITPYWTARYLRLLDRNHMDREAGFVRQQLLKMRGENSWEVALTKKAPAKPLQLENGRVLYPDKSRSQGDRELAVHAALDAHNWSKLSTNGFKSQRFEESVDGHVSDFRIFLVIAFAFYGFILCSTLFWWRFRGFRHSSAGLNGNEVVTFPVMQLAEERWANRVLGLIVPEGAEMTRYSNSPVEQNFLMQLRTIYKLVLEWRRSENKWPVDGRELVSDEKDPWLNGADEFAVIVGIYMRSVIKTGTKDGFSKTDVLKENEDSNHIWSRLLIYFSEYYWSLLELMRQVQEEKAKQQSEQTVRATLQPIPGFNEDDGASESERAMTRLNEQIGTLLNAMGMRQRFQPFDARKLFNFPANPDAMDLMVIQKPGATLTSVIEEMDKKLKIPRRVSEGFISKYKAFKKRERPYPVHPYLIEYAKVMPHFFLMGLGATVIYNATLGEGSMVQYLWGLISQAALSPASLLWAVPIAIGIGFSYIAQFTRIYRYDSRMASRPREAMLLDLTVTTFFSKPQSTSSGRKEGKWWNAEWYEPAGLAFRVIGLAVLFAGLMSIETASFTTFLLIKGLLSIVVLAELLGIIFPLLAEWISKSAQDRVTTGDSVPRAIRFLNSLNITATKPASTLWLSIKYHTQPSAPTGGFWPLVQATLFYFGLTALFFTVGVFLCQEMFPLWFTEKYLLGDNVKMFIGAIIFWNTMYLLRYGLFLLCTGIASFLATWPLRGCVLIAALVDLALLNWGPRFGVVLPGGFAAQIIFALIAIVVSVSESSIISWWRRVAHSKQHLASEDTAFLHRLDVAKSSESNRLGIVYMSGDDLACQKLTPVLLLARWRLLREKLGSSSIPLLKEMGPAPDDAALQQLFQELYDAEKKAAVTLWHPSQIRVAGEEHHLESSLTIEAASKEIRQRMVIAWHYRRWLVTMMSTAGHAQDTGVNLVDFALRLDREKLAAQTVFYLVQNKFDQSEGNRPSELNYLGGELAQRNKLARLLCALAPGARAYNLQNWTPFGFKAGGLTGMDLVHEESLKLSTLLFLDRNANVHDLDAVMSDITCAMADPNVVVVIPGRGTTNTHTAIGQASQLVEEGHRSFLKGLMSWLGGKGSEAVGTGWGNIVACHYGRVQRALLNPQTPKMPLTNRMMRGSSFAVRTEGLIGFTPHAVGISEDTWAVSQAAHHAMALGYRAKFLVSQALWHKIRETWSHSEWLASFPRWSGGYLQMMHDPVMQKINDFGPAPIFCKEIRANSGRNFLTAPFALLNILAMPLAIMFDVTPFVQILIVLWNFGFVMNQILTIHGLNAYLESTGFRKEFALLVTLITGLLMYAGNQLSTTTVAWLPLVLLASGYTVGIGRWLYTRLRDVLLFGPQLVLHAIGQMVRQTLEFTVSGASPEDVRGVNVAYRTLVGPREDKAQERFANLINLRTVVWGIGLFSLTTNLIALTSLDMLNVLLLLPSFLFSVSTIAGPFLMAPHPGNAIGKWIALPKILGWSASITFYIFVSLLVAEGGFASLGAGLLLSTIMVLLLVWALRCITVRFEFGRLHRQLLQLFKNWDLLNPNEAAELFLKLDLRYETATEKLIATWRLDQAQREALVPYLLTLSRIQTRLQPPGLLTKKNPRALSEFLRTFVLSFLILLCFFIVPVPGLLVFSAGNYSMSMSLGNVTLIVAGAILICIASYWISKITEKFSIWGVFGFGGLVREVEMAYQRLQAATVGKRALTDEEISYCYALFTDLQTYIDQRSYAYARAALQKLRERLDAAQAG